MFTGKMIEELTAAVERAEDHALLAANLTLKKTVYNDIGSSTHIYERTFVGAASAA
jgi:hypothetical protein